MDKGKTITEIAAELVAKNTQTATPAASMPSASTPMPLAPQQTKDEFGALIARPIEYNVNPLAVYDRLGDGSYVAKYDNYLGETGNEDRLARLQSTQEKMWNGLSKNLTKMGNYVLDATVGTAYGLYKGVTEGSMSAVWDNSFSNTLDDWNKALDYKIPNYYSDEEKSMGFLQSMGTANFWFNDVANGLAFVGGALIPEFALATLTGGVSAPTTLAKWGFKAGAKALGKEAADVAINTAGKTGKFLDKAADAVAREKGTGVLRDYYRGIYADKTGDVLNTAGYLFRTSNFEAGMEARHNFKDAVATFTETFEEKNGRQPTSEELMDFTQKAKNSANGVYGANLAILSVSNAAMFGKTFDINILPGARKSVDNFFNKAIGLGTKTLEDGTTVLQQANRAQKIAGTTFKILEKPLTEGLYEEGMQGVIGKTMQGYLEQQYDPKSNDSASMWAAMTDAFAEQYGTKEGWKEMGIGMIIGFAGGAFAGQGLSGVGKNSYNSIKKEKEKDLTVSNEGIKNLQSNVDGILSSTDRGVQTLRAMSKANAARVSRDSAYGEYAPAIDNLKTNHAFIQSQEHLKTPTEIQKDFDLVVDKMEVSQEQMEVLQEQGFDVDTYKESLKSEFADTLESYRFGKKVVKALGLDQKIEDGAGNIHNIGDAMVWNLMMGKNAASNARKIAKEIETATGVLGIADYVDFYHKLSVDQKTSVDELNSARKEVEKLRAEGLKLQGQLAGAQQRGRGTKKDSTIDRKYKDASEKVVLNTQRIQELESKIRGIETALETDFRGQGFELGERMDGPQILSVGQAVEELSKLDDYVASLEAVGNNVEADFVKSLMLEYKVYADAHQEFINGHRKISSENFFKSGEGKTFLRKVLGPKYQMSDEFKQLIRDNERKIDESLGLVGVRTAAVEEFITEAIEKNPKLSDREKYQLEAMLRFQLVAESFNDIMDEMSELKDTSDTTPETTVEEGVAGDTISLRRKMDITADKISSIEALDKVINEVLDQISYLRNSLRDPSRIAALEAEIVALNNRKKELGKKKAPAKDISTMRLALQQLQDNMLKEIESEFGNQENINELEKQIKKLEKQIENAVKESEKQQQEGDQQGDQLQRSGTDQGQQNKGKETTEEADNRYSNLTSKEEIDSLIAVIEEEIKGAKESIKMVDSPEYVRVDELSKKEQAEGLTEAEAQELNELRADIDQWMLVTGTVVEGVRLSDLTKQRAAISSAPVQKIDNVQETTLEEQIEEMDFQDSTAKANYSFGQTYESVTFRYDRKTDSVVLSGIVPTEMPEIFTETLADGSIRPLDFEFQVDLENNNIIIAAAELAKINTATSNVSVMPTNKDLNTVHSVVIRHTTDMAGSRISLPLVSSYKGDYSVPQNSDAIYALENGSPVTLKVDTRDQYNIDKIKAYKAAKGKAAKAAAKEVLRKSLRITIFDANGNFIATLKGKRLNAKKSKNDTKFEQFRDSIIDNEQLFEKLIGIQSLQDLNTAPITVKKVFLGQPNYNLVKNEDGTVSFQYRMVSEQDAKKIVDLGYIEAGKIRTRSGVMGIDTTFLAKKAETQKEGRIPFVVIEKNGRRIAIPVKTARRDRPDTTELQQVFKSKADPVSKVVKLNQLLAAYGIDIKKPGNFFYVIGNTNNLTDKFLSDKLAQVNNIDYFYSIDEWMDKKIPQEQILTQQVMVNVNLSNPLHSPKVLLDLTRVLEPFKGQNTVDKEVKEDKTKAANTRTAKTSSTPVKQSKTSQRLSKLKSEKDINKSAKDEINKKCD